MPRRRSSTAPLSNGAIPTGASGAPTREGIEKIAAILKERTGGKFTIKIGYGEMFSKDKENLDSIKLDAIEMADMCNFYHPGKNPAWMVFSLAVPAVRRVWSVSAAAADAMMKHPALVADMAQWNAMPYFFTILPQYEFMGKGKPPKTLDDWKGLRVRRPAPSARPSSSLGAHPVDGAGGRALHGARARHRRCGLVPVHLCARRLSAAHDLELVHLQLSRRRIAGLQPPS